jgi:single-stranded DNA-specific DHH superfamily exonuclease
VDNGISSLDGVGAARAANIDVLVTDHHLPGEQLPAANAIVNPNVPGSGFPGKHLAGVGVAFYLAAALGRALGQPATAAAYLDLVALGTVADLVVLDHCNRILVAQGLMPDQGRPVSSWYSCAVRGGRCESTRCRFRITRVSDCAAAERSRPPRRHVAGCAAAAHRIR